MSEKILEVRQLATSFHTERGWQQAIDGVSFDVYQGEILGIVGESGCGKSVTSQSIMRLYDERRLVRYSGTVKLEGQSLLDIPFHKMQDIRGSRVSMIFQDALSSLNPVLTICDQISEPLRIHQHLSKKAAREKALEMLRLVGIPAPEKRLDQYPHELSGGMRQRVGDMLMEVLAIHHIGDKNERMARALDIMAQVGLRPEHFYRYPHEFSGGQRQRIGLARALILDPKIVVCDEPVSALDVSIQSQIINLLKELQRKRGLTYLFVAHDMSVIRYISDRVGVMYLGHLVEEGDTDEVFDHPQHPYTRTLMSAVPSIDPRDNRQRILLEGDLPSPIDPPSGCVFHTRCPWATEACKTASCELREVRKGHYAACSRGEQE